MQLLHWNWELCTLKSVGIILVWSVFNCCAMLSTAIVTLFIKDNNIDAEAIIAMLTVNRNVFSGLMNLLFTHLQGRYSSWFFSWTGCRQMASGWARGYGYVVFSPPVSQFIADKPSISSSLVSLHRSMTTSTINNHILVNCNANGSDSEILYHDNSLWELQVLSVSKHFYIIWQKDNSKVVGVVGWPGKLNWHASHVCQ